MPETDFSKTGVPAASIRHNVMLSSLSRWRIGGAADVVMTPRDESDLAAILRYIKAAAVPHVIIGDGSNLLFDDAGFRGVIVHIGRSFGGCDISPDDATIAAGAGFWVPSLVRHSVNAGLAGIIHAIGIPGTLGGLVVMNGGSQRKGIGDHVVAVEAMDYEGRLHRLEKADLGFAYRRSVLQDGGLVVTRVLLQLTPGDAVALRREAISIMAARRAKFPKVRANCGSVFVSDPKLYALMGPPGEAIEKAGLKGLRMNGAQISPEHANFIVNNGGAHSEDVLRLIHEARARVAEASGIWMEAEVRHVRPDGVIRPAHISAAELTASLSSDDRCPAPL
ncbi:MAG: UDP-N-acetylmuramate dehydrogenase [Sphingobium sp.]|nr:UDP-N-acetylmuramate dehydrogenase [Sphingobium sp.]